MTHLKTIFITAALLAFPSAALTQVSPDMIEEELKEKAAQDVIQGESVDGEPSEEADSPLKGNDFENNETDIKNNDDISDDLKREDLWTDQTPNEEGAEIEKSYAAPVWPDSSEPALIIPPEKEVCPLETELTEDGNCKAEKP